jgi:hypothetical protein
MFGSDYTQAFLNASNAINGNVFENFVNLLARALNRNPQHLEHNIQQSANFQLNQWLDFGQGSGGMFASPLSGNNRDSLMQQMSNSVRQSLSSPLMTTWVRVNDDGILEELGLGRGDWRYMQTLNEEQRNHYIQIRSEALMAATSNPDYARLIRMAQTNEHNLDQHMLQWGRNGGMRPARTRVSALEYALGTTTYDGDGIPPWLTGTNVIRQQVGCPIPAEQDPTADLAITGLQRYLSEDIRQRAREAGLPLPLLDPEAVRQAGIIDCTNRMSDELAGNIRRNGPNGT